MSMQYINIVLYCIVLKYLYSAPQQPKANRGAWGKQRQICDVCTSGGSRILD